MRTNNAAIVTAGDMSGNVTSKIIYLDQVIIVSVQAVWTGTPLGNLKLQVSNDMGPDLNGNGSVTNWSDLPDSIVALAGVAGSYPWNYDNLGYRWAQLVYISNSGSGTLNARQNIKGF